MSIYVGESKALLLKNDRSVVEFYKGDKKLFGYNNAKQGNMIIANNVHPIEHKLKINLSSDTITDFSGVNVTRCGKNIFDAATVLPTFRNPNYPSMYWKKQQDDSWYLGNAGVLNNSVWFENVEGYTGQMAISIAAKVPEGKEGVVSLTLLFVYTDGTKESIRCHHSDDFVMYTLVSDATKVVSKIMQSYSTGYNVFIKDIMLSYGDSTDYEPYNPQTITAKVDGTVDGLTSLSPKMTVMSDNTDTILNVSYC